VALGILLLYSTVYFAGSVYAVIPYVAVVVLYVVIALSSHAIALWLDTKVVAALGVVGISLMPMLSNIIVAQPNYYLISLVLVTLSSVIIAYRYVGLWLAHLSLAFVLIALEWVINVDGAYLSAIFIDLFYLIFFAYIYFSLIRNTDSNKQLLIFLAALVGANVGFFFQATSLFSDPISLGFVVNAVASIIAAYMFFKREHVLTHIMILVSAIWTVLAVVSFISQAYWSIAWAVEGLFLLYLGRRYRLPMVINQGQVLTAISLVACVVSLIPYFPVPALLTLNGWALSLSMVAIIAIWMRLINDNPSFNRLTITKIKPILIAVEAIWLTILTLAVMHHWLGLWAASLVIFGQLALLYRAKFTRQVSLDIWAALLFIVPVVYVVDAAIEFNVYRFSSLPLAAKFAVGSIFAQLWLFAEFYRRYRLNNAMVEISEWARIVFYLLLPVCWWGTAIRHLEIFSIMIFWLSPLIAVMLALKIKHVFIVWQAKILVAMASVLLCIGIVALPMFAGSIVLGVFSLFYIGAFVANKRTGEALYQYIYSVGILILGIALPIWVHEWTNSDSLALITAAMYWGALLNRSIVWESAKWLQVVTHVVSGLIILIAWVGIEKSVAFALVPVIYIIAALYDKEKSFKHSLVGNKLGNNSELGLHFIGAITYLIVLFELSYYHLDLLIAPALAIHGALILFMKDRRLTTIKFSFGLILLGIVKLGLLDAANVLLWQKVMLFMGIGILMLGASFWYQKLIRTTDSLANKNDTIDIKSDE